MNTIVPSKEQSKHSAADIFIAFEYQWDFFVLSLLSKSIDSTVEVSFELFDDVAIQQGQSSIVLCQVKHSVQKSKKGKTINLSNRDVDLWKTISIWIKIIDEIDPSERDNYLSNIEFHLVTNKTSEKNQFVKALNSFIESNNISDFKSKVNEIAQSGKSDSEITDAITSFLSKSYLEKFVKQIVVISKPDCLRNEILAMLHTRAFIAKSKVNQVYNSLMTELRDAVKSDIENRKAIVFTGETFANRFHAVFEMGRANISFRHDYDFNDFDGDPQKLLFIQQLEAINELPKQEGKRLDAIVSYTKEWFQFKNNLHELTDNNILIGDDILKLSNDVQAAWNNYHNSAYRMLDLCSSEDELCKAGCSVIDNMRREYFNLGNTPLEQMLSHGCIYYYSNTPTHLISDLPYIGWHIDWESKFKKS
ncbi:DUF4297 domain-containing protein [Bacteroides acidifaciens]|mgnify:CR=1 FL=1|uniref:DUF4297 domain-containing protein n=1 Tax=Bacteroides acidifaciens TaxID=85831 RepID=UPI002637735D|nr:DUF4297 domain-containing protein [Bacteroides acidifaciens]